MEYTVKQKTSNRESFGDYTYEIHRNGKFVANYWHDYRGDEHGIEFVNGEKDSWPVGRMIDFLTDGGPNPTSLSSAAITYLNGKLT